MAQQQDVKHSAANLILAFSEPATKPALKAKNLLRTSSALLPNLRLALNSFSSST